MIRSVIQIAKKSVWENTKYVYSRMFQTDPTPPDDSVPPANLRVSAYSTYRPLHFAHNFPPVHRCGSLPRCRRRIRNHEKRIFPPLNADILVSEEQKRKKKKRTNPNPITNYFSPLTITRLTRLDHPVKDDLPHMDRYENRSFGSANILDPSV
jgi:hypothetical protein